MNFWEVHNIIFLIGIAFFPRLTLLVSSVAFGGVLWWIGFIITPHLLVAILATTAYWDTNPVLVIISWIFALLGTSKESSTVNNHLN